jgi:flavin reductase (DIM6/NTAB) family NADH-FMN oxidoreductase RutF
MAVKMVADPTDREDVVTAVKPRISPELFREAFSYIPAPVSIVTAVKDGKAHGTTVSAFCSLSADPPLALVALDRGSDLLRIVRETGAFGVNALSAEQGELARRCARKGQEKLAEISWRLDHALPRIDGSGTWLVCKLHGELDGGDHVILAGLIVHAEVSPQPPLLYYRRRFVALES